MKALAEWNAMEPAAAAAEILACNGSRAWAAALAARRPFAEVETLLAASDEVWQRLPEAAWQEAFDTHPRIGEAKPKTEATGQALETSQQALQTRRQALEWSSGEQAAAMVDEAGTRQALAEANRRYEARFGRVFLICATGRTAGEILACLQTRLSQEPEAEWIEAAEQQRQITRLRLRKWLAAGTEQGGAAG